MGGGARTSRTRGRGCLRVARNLAEDYAKSAFRRNGTQPPELLNGVRSSQTARRAKSWNAHELFAQVRAVLDELAPADREILTLRYALDYDAHDDRRHPGRRGDGGPHAAEPARQRLAERLATHGD